MFGGTRDNFATLNKILDQPHVQIGAVRKACWAVEDCIAQNRDNLRGFFDKCFPNLLKRIFGYDDFEASWLNIVTKSGKEDDARALVSLLSPTGRLMSAMFSADADQLIKYIFPVERLPAHTQELLKTHAGRCELEQWPQYRGHLVLNALGNPQTYLSVFEYFMFWTAFYVLRGGRSMRDGAATPGGRGMGGLGLLGSAGHWGGLSADHLLSDIRRMGSTLITGFHHGAHGTPLHTHPYYTLLRAYLKYLIPRPLSLASPASPQQDSCLEGSSKAEKAYAAPLNQLVLSILMEFWLTDASEPVPLDGLDLHQAAGAPAHKPLGSPTVAATSTAAAPPTTSAAATAAAAVGSAGASGMRLPDGGGTPLAAGGAAVPATLRVLSYQPPPEELVEALTQLFRYIHVVDLPTRRGPIQQQQQQQQQQPSVRPAQSGTEGPWLPEVPVRTITPMTASAAAAAAATAGGSTGRGPASSSAVALLAGPSASPAVQASSRKLYRFLRRTFAQWPLSSSASLMPIISLFLTILTPWAAPSAATAPTTTSPALAHAIPSAKPTAGDATSSHRRGLGVASPPSGQAQPTPGSIPSLQHQAWLESVAQLGSELTHRLHPHHHHHQPQEQSHKQQCSYTPEWQHHVLTHLPFYSILVPQLLALAFARLSLQGDVAAAELLLLLRALQASGPQLMQELRSAERAYNGYLAAHKRRPEGPLADLLPWVAEQTLGFEAAAVAGAQPSMPMQVDTSFRLFTLGTSGAPHYGSAILRAAQAQVRPELRDALADAMFAVLPITDVSADMQPPPEPPQLAAALRAYPRAGHWAQLHYKGDWLARPIASHEIGPLVRLLVWVSRWLNHALGLDVPWRGDDVEEEAENVLQDGLRWMRRKGFRISLRFLAEVQTLGWLLVASLLVSMMLSSFNNQQPGPVPLPHARPQPGL